jgi:hypothetical protein
MASNFRTLGFASTQATQKFVAYIDILGFSSRTMNNFEEASKLYDMVVDFIAVANDTTSQTIDINIRIISDSILLVSSNLVSVILGANIVQHAVLMCDLLVRGGIAQGMHREMTDSDNLYLASEALVKAVKLEREIKWPCVVLDDSLAPPPSVVLPLPDNSFLRKLLYVDGRWIVSPFNIMWGFSASTRVQQLREKHPEYSEKYDWFLKLYDSVRNGDPLLPSEWLRRPA